VIQNVDDPLPLTPSITKTWFHTGAPGDLGNKLATEWTAIAVDPGACAISNVEREAYRALKGRPLRVEVFADDGNPLPYLVTASTHAVVKLTDRVYRVDDAQTVAVHIERGTSARTEHTLVLDVDGYGNIKLQAKVCYGLSSGEAEQSTPVVLVTQTDFASFDPTKGWHPHTPWRTRTWELGIAVTGTVTASALKIAFDAATVRDFDEALTTGQKRLLSAKVVVYANDTGTAALVHTTWVRAFTAAQATTLGVTMTDGGYVQRADGAWWVPSGTPSWDPDRFWVVTAITDPFGQITDIASDSTGRFTTGVVDPVGNSAAATWDPRTLQPLTVTDPNGTTTTVSYDALGRVVDVWISDGTDGDTTSPSSSFTYSFTVPASARAKARANHGDADFTHETVSYSDGGGAVVQQKVKVSATEWVGTGRIIHDQKGNPVKQYEPFFTSSDEWEPEAGFDGVTVLITYDPLGRAVRVDNPDGTYRTVTFDPWTQTTADECDNDSSSPHAGTPNTVHLDAQGRPYRTDEVLDGSTTFTTRLTLDTVGNALVVTDANGLATQTQAFDLLGRPWSSRSPDTNDPGDPDDVDLVFLDLTGQPLRVARSGGLVVETAYDALRRKSTITADGVVRERFVYGEGTAKAAGRILEIWDRAGRVVYAYDFKGNVIDERRRFATDPAAVLDWTTTSTTGLGSDYITTRTFDAQSRPKTQTTPDNSTTNLGYDVAGRLNAVSANLRGSSTATNFVTGISYNARGQRAGITYQNGVASTLTYDPLTFRLTRILTMRGSDTVQDLNYAYDPVGNITQITDNADARTWYNNSVIDPTRTYVYDALYRLVHASGREKNPNATIDWADPAYGPLTPTNAVDTYVEDFVYDPVGNLQSITHDGVVDWTRAYAYATGTNRLATTTVGSNTVSYSHNTRGAMTAMPHLAAIDVDDRDQMVRAAISSTEDWLYVYDSGGQRVRKVRRTGSSVVQDRLYIGAFEVWTNGSDLVETLHLMDGQRRIALFDAKTTSTSTTTTTRYQLDDHLGSAAWELDEDGEVLSYEEFHPYGTTAWWVHSTSVSLKRYRFTGMERDEETGLQCHGVRYYATWLGRWTSADPIGLGDGVNRFRYCHNRPTGGYDPGGTADFGWYDRLSTAAHATYDAAVSKATSASDTLVAVATSTATAVAHPIDTAVAVYNASPHKKVVEGDYPGAAKQMASMYVGVAKLYVENAKTGAQTAGTVVGNASGVLPATNLYFLTTGDKAEVKVAAEANVDQLATTASVTASGVAPEMAAGALARVAPLIRGAGVAPKVAAPVVEELSAVAEVAPVASRGAPYLADVLEGHGPRQGFTGVYDAATGRIGLRPSTAEVPLPEGWVARSGGHGAVSAELGGDASGHAGFAAILEEGGGARLTWRSGTINAPPEYVVPEAMRPTVVSAFEQATGLTVTSW
jgi:RHS repeat-associated protein